MDNRPGRGFADREQEHAEKPQGQDQETYVGHQKYVGDDSRQGKSIEIENDERKQQYIDCNRNPSSVFKLGHYPAR